LTRQLIYVGTTTAIQQVADLWMTRLVDRKTATPRTFRATESEYTVTSAAMMLGFARRPFLRRGRKLVLP
jgi:hypothetical protein